MATAKIRVPLNTLECPNCLETVVDPRILPCGHSLCGPRSLNNCLFKLEENFGPIKCPSCQITHSVQAADVPTSFTLRDMLESVEPMEETKVCKVHGKEIVAVCKTDGDKICMRCVKNHAGHDIRDIEEEEFETLSFFWKTQSGKLDDMITKYGHCKDAIKDFINYLEQTYLKIDSIQAKLTQVASKKDNISRKLVEGKFNPKDEDIVILKEFLELKESLQINVDKVSHFGKSVATCLEDLYLVGSTELIDKANSPIQKYGKQTTVLALGIFGGETIVGDQDELTRKWNNEKPFSDFGTGFQAVCYKKKLYVIGGRKKRCWQPVKSVHVFSISNNKLTQGPSLTMDRSDMTSCFHESSRSIFVIGGNCFNRNYLETIERLVLNDEGDAVGEWEMITPMPVEATDSAAAALGDCLYVCGGTNKSGRMDLVQIFNVPTGTWKLGSPMKNRRYGHSATTVGNKVYVMGGSLTKFMSSLSGSCEVYDPALNVWSSISSMPIPKYCFGAAVLNDQIYIVGGYADSTKAHRFVHVYDTQTNKWSTGAQRKSVDGFTVCVSW